MNNIANIETKALYPRDDTTPLKLEGLVKVIRPHDASKDIGTSDPAGPYIPPGTYGEPGWINIWAYNSNVGIRLVTKNIILPDDIIMTACGTDGGWTGWGVKRGWFNNQFELCDGSGGYFAAYSDTTAVLYGWIESTAIHYYDDPRFDWEEILLDFC